MGLHDRLNILRREAGNGPAAPGQDSARAVAEDAAVRTDDGPEALRARLERMGVTGTGRGGSPRRARSQTVSAAQLAQRLGGEQVDEHLICVDRLEPAQRRHGRHSLALVADAARPFWEPDARVGFLDTETTGLAGGAGSVAFLVGLATREAEGVRLRQWIMTAFAGEGALLAAVDAALDACEHLVSYNGKTFDLPLLRDRRRMQRRPDACEPAHTDFLHPVRSLYGHAWPDCRLRTVEERLLGLVRQDDLPGSEAPWAWKTYLTCGRSEALEWVLRHNSDDILSLVLLGPVLARTLAHPVAYHASVEGAARLLQRLEGAEAARSVLEAGSSELSPAGRLWLAREWRREHRYDRALPIWEELAEDGSEEALEALAKYHEHQRRDWRQALHYAERLAPGAQADARRHRLRARCGSRLP
ncbi:MAG: ribonuclease H-like domain-containing protein [Thioalkalivibrio sp.]|nr:ribonuclease H-like domain-containing protein [Thioalkalivibrio sp.]